MLGARLKPRFSEQIAHNDLKPANILVYSCAWLHPEPRLPATLLQIEAKLADLGLARHLDTPVAWLDGSSGWRAPEQQACSPDAPRVVRGSVDVYSAGAIITQLLMPGMATIYGGNSGHSVTTWETKLAAGSAYLADLPDALAGVPELAHQPLITLLTSMLAADPLERPTARDAQAALEAVQW